MEEQYQSNQPTESSILMNDNQVPPQAMKKKNSGLKWLLIVILLLAIAGVAGFFLTRSQSDEIDASPEPTFFEESLPTDTPTPTPSEVSKKDISIEVQNGTGVAGEAGFLQKELEKLGFTEIEVGNATTQDATTTTVTYASTVNDEVKDEVTTMLKSVYKTVETKSSSSLKDSDILIVTGVRKGATTASSTPKASSTATPRSSASPTATARPSATPTTTPTSTP